MTDPTAMARALWYVGEGRAEIREEALPPLAAGAVRVRALHGAISRGTEALVASGGVPETERQRMRAPFMGGDFPFPVKYGYATVGRVELGAAELLGRTVFSLHPHQTLFDVPAEAAAPLSANVPAARGILAANMETALNALWDAEPKPGWRVAVVGAGVVGALTGFLCRRLAGADVTLVDVNDGRAAVAAKLGLGFASPLDAPRDCDLVVHTSASAAGLATALDLARTEATVLEMSWYGAKPVSVPLGGAFHSRRLRLVSSQVGMVAPSHRAEWSYRRRLDEAIRLLADDALDVLIAPPVRFENLPADLPQIFDPRSGILCQRIDYN